MFIKCFDFYQSNNRLGVFLDSYIKNTLCIEIIATQKYDTLTHIFMSLFHEDGELNMKLRYDCDDKYMRNTCWKRKENNRW